MSKLFYVNTFDKISTEILAALISTHPDIHCSKHNNREKLLPTANEYPLDVDMRLNQDPFSIASGNIGGLGAYEMLYKGLLENPSIPFRKVKITMSPILRVRFLTHSWIQTGMPLDALYQATKAELTQSKTLITYRAYEYFFMLQEFILLNLQTHHLMNSNVSDVAQKKLPDLTLPMNRLFIMALSITLTFDSADLPVASKTFQFEKLLTDDKEFFSLIDYISNGQAKITDEFLDKYKKQQQEINNFLSEINNDPWNVWHFEILEHYMNEKMDVIHGKTRTKSMGELYALAGYDLQSKEEYHYTKLVSIQLHSNRPALLSILFDNIEDTADDPSKIEVLVNIDNNNTNMKALLDLEKTSRKFTLKYIESEPPKSFYDLWAPLNQLLKITDPDAYFCLNLSDKTLFVTHGWDTQLKNYVGFYPDHIFRLRTSRNRYRNYFDPWECMLAQDTLPFITKRWLDIVGDWSPCFGSDSFQQSTAYYLAKAGQFSNRNFLRDIPIGNIQFHEDAPLLGMTQEQSWKIFSGSLKVLFINQSHKMQQEAKRRAQLLKAHIIIASEPLAGATIIDNLLARTIQIKIGDTLHFNSSYKLSYFAITLTNQWRKLMLPRYFGTGLDYQSGIWIGIRYYLMARFRTCHTLFMKIATANAASRNFVLNLPGIKHYRIKQYRKFLAAEKDKLQTRSANVLETEKV